MIRIASQLGILNTSSLSGCNRYFIATAKESTTTSIKQTMIKAIQKSPML